MNNELENMLNETVID